VKIIQLRFCAESPTYLGSTSNHYSYNCNILYLRGNNPPSCLHRIGRQQSPVCPYCGGDDETAQHLLLCCPSHTPPRTCTNYISSTDPQRMWSFLESIGAVTRFLPPLPRLGTRETERQQPGVKLYVAVFILLMNVKISEDSVLFKCVSKLLTSGDQKVLGLT